MKKLRIGVIGTGNMGRNHIRVLSDEGRFDLVGIYDINQENAQEIADIYGTVLFETAEALLKQVDAVVIAVPSILHREIGMLAATHRVHALIEKPLSVNAADAAIITEAFREQGLKLQVGHIERFNPVITELRKILEGKTVFYLEAHRYSPFSGSGRITDTSVVEDLMIHDIDIVCSLMHPATVTDIRANGECVTSEMIDFSTCMLDFSSNAHAIINASRISQSKERTLDIHTKECVISADLLTKTLTITNNTELEFQSDHSGSYKQEAIVQKVYVPLIEPLRAELISFYNAVVNNEEILVNGDVAIEAIRICEEVVKKSSY